MRFFQHFKQLIPEPATLHPRSAFRCLMVKTCISRIVGIWKDAESRWDFLNQQTI